MRTLADVCWPANGSLHGKTETPARRIKHCDRAARKRWPTLSSAESVGPGRAVAVVGGPLNQLGRPSSDSVCAQLGAQTRNNCKRRSAARCGWGFAVGPAVCKEALRQPCRRRPSQRRNQTGASFGHEKHKHSRSTSPPTKLSARRVSVPLGHRSTGRRRHAVSHSHARRALEPAEPPILVVDPSKPLPAGLHQRRADRAALFDRPPVPTHKCAFCPSHFDESATAPPPDHHRRLLLSPPLFDPSNKDTPTMRELYVSPKS